jgi:hypothetical protein
MALSFSRLAAIILAVACAFAIAPPAMAASKDKNGKPLRGVIYYQGGYKYKKSTAKARDWRFVDPAPASALSSTRQSPGGPFDSGFFFDSGVGSWVGGQAPYQH